MKTVQRENRGRRGLKIASSVPSCERCSKRGKHYACSRWWRRRMRIDYGRFGHPRGAGGLPHFHTFDFDQLFSIAPPSESCLEYFSNLNVRSTLCGVAHVAIFAHGTRRPETARISNGEFCTLHLWPDSARSINFGLHFDGFSLSRCDFFLDNACQPVRFGKALLE